MKNEIELVIDPVKLKKSIPYIIGFLVGGFIIFLISGGGKKIVEVVMGLRKLGGVPDYLFNKIKSIIKEKEWKDPIGFSGEGGLFLFPGQILIDKENKFKSLSPEFLKKIKPLWNELWEWCKNTYGGKLYPAVYYSTRPLGIQAQLVYLGYTKTFLSKHLIGHAIDIYPYAFGLDGKRGWINERHPLWNDTRIINFYKKIDELANKYGLVRIAWDKPHIENKVDFYAELSKYGLIEKFKDTLKSLCSISDLKEKLPCREVV